MKHGMQMGPSGFGASHGMSSSYHTGDMGGSHGLADRAHGAGFRMANVGRVGYHPHEMAREKLWKEDPAKALASSEFAPMSAKDKTAFHKQFSSGGGRATHPGGKRSHFSPKYGR